MCAPARNDIFSRSAVGFFVVRRGGALPRPYASDCRGGRPCPPSPGNATLCRAGPVCPAVGAVRNPSVTALPCQPPLGKGAEGTGGADCHSPCAHWLRNDREFYMGCGRRADVGIGPYGYIARGAGRAESPSPGFAVPAPFRQGGRGDGGTDCHGRGAPSQ